MNIPLFKVSMNDMDLGQVLCSGYISQGPIVNQFEHKLRKLVGNGHCLTVNSATSGLTLAVRLAGAEGGEVVSTALTCFATTAAILANNCSIVWADVDRSCGLDLELLSGNISNKTRAIVAVHWGGVSVDMDRLFSIRDECEELYGTEIYVIQDCAHAFLSSYDGQIIGANPFRRRSIGVYSFQAIKHLTTGDGGMVVVPPELYERGKRLRWFGINRDGMKSRLEEDIPEWGYKFHMNDINAKIGVENIQGLLEKREVSRANAKYYDEHVLCDKQIVSEKCNPNYWLYTLFMPKRNEFQDFMRRYGIQVSPVHKRNDINSCVAQFSRPLPQLDELASLIVSIPVGWWVTKEDTAKITSLCNQYYKALTPESPVKNEISQPDVLIRYVQPNDANDIIKLYNQERPQPIELWSDDVVNYLNTIHSSSDATFLYAILVDNNIIGMAKLIIENKLGYKMGRIEDVYIDCNHRKQGYGTLLIQRLVADAKTFSVTKIVLGSHVPRLYSRLGFTHSGTYMTMIV